MIFDTIAAIADYKNNKKFDNNATREEIESILSELSNAKQEILTIGQRQLFNDEIKRYTYWVDGVQHKTPRSKIESEVSNFESSSSSSSSSSSVPALKFQVRVTISDVSQDLPGINYANAVDFTVEWGDGTSDNNQGGTKGIDYVEHAYSEPGSYVISMSGETSYLAITDSNYTVVYELLTPIQGITGLTDLAFFIQSPITSISSDFFKNCSAVTNMSSAFYASTITEIPAGLFDSLVNVTDFSNIFDSCQNFTSIPAGLFDNCVSAENFNSAFLNCNNLETIPANLFTHCVSATNFESSFSITGIVSIPSGLFSGLSTVETFANVFSACISLESIPGDMFYGCSGVKNMANMFSGSLITSIPAGLFDSCVNVETFAVSFYGTSITSIPAALFDNCNSVSDFSYTFQKCYSLTGDAPELWTRIPEPNGQACFEGDTGLTNYGSIPSGWKTG